MSGHANGFQTIRSEGGLLSSDLLRRVLDPRSKLPGALPEDYGLPRSERLNEAITQSWNRLRKHWSEFRVATADLPESEPATGVTNDKWSLPLLRELGFGLLPTSSSPEVKGRIYAINRFFGPVPLHLIGRGLSLDRRAAGVRGAAAVNPHGLLQEFLNRSPAHLWGIVTNGLRLRVQRDNQALSRQSFLEFDLEAMFSGEVYSDFVLLWLVVHATRFAPREGERTETCWLEQWSKLANEQGTRVLGDLRGGVERALHILGEGFTSHQKNIMLRDALRNGQLTLVEFHGQLLRVVYRLIFLFVAEDRLLEGRPLLHPLDTSDTARIARERYAAHYSATRLRELASKIKGSRHGDLWRQFQIVVRALSGNPHFATARDHLALPALGNFLWDPGSTAALGDAELSNHDFLEVVRQLAFTRQDKVLRPVDYRNLGAEELGGVYESLLALTPQISADGARFTFAEFAGSERKTSGSYYTPDSLVQCLLDSALDPVVEEAIKGKIGVEAEKAILALKVCDPAVGSGHFLVGAAHRLARHLARVRALAQGESEPSPLLYQHALRDVIGCCLYGVDVNPMAAELCKVSLWMEALEPGKPLSFLDHHIRVGNSLLGTTPELLVKGIPDGAFQPIEGDDKKACSVLKKRNSGEREGFGELFAQQDAATQTSFQEAASAIDALPDDNLDQIRKKSEAFFKAETDEAFKRKQQLADTWCAAFVIPKTFKPGTMEPVGITQVQLNDVAQGKPLLQDVAKEVGRLSAGYVFFHWHLAFPEVFGRQGFDVVLGNPPWERTALEDDQFFATRLSAVAEAPTTAERKQIIASLSTTHPSIFREYIDARRQAASETALLSNTGRYPLSAQGRLNTYAIFAELALRLLNPRGKAGIIVQTGIATDAPMEMFWKTLVDTKTIESIFDFENRKGIFTGVHRSMKFCLLTLHGGLRGPADTIRCGFYLQNVTELDKPTSTYSLTADILSIVNPNTKQPPVCRSQIDLDLVAHCQRAHPILMSRDNANYRAKAWRALMSAGSSQHYRSLEHIGMEEDIAGDPSFLNIDGKRFVALIEAKQIHQFDPSFATYRQVSRSERQAGEPRLTELSERFEMNMPLPRFWANEAIVEEMYAAKEWSKPWSVGIRDVTNSTNERTAIMIILPRLGLVQPLNGVLVRTAIDALWITSAVNSFACDYVAKQKTPGSHLNVTIFSQLPVPLMQEDNPFTRDIITKTLELSYVVPALAQFAQECGYDHPPFRWDEERRFLLRCELDAAFFHLYLPAEKNGDWHLAEGETPEDLARLKASFPTPRHAVSYIMDTFLIVKRKDEEKFGNYRTKDTILEIYDAMSGAIRTGRPYRPRLDPPPADPRVAHGGASSKKNELTVIDAENVFRRISAKRSDRYKTCVPLTDLKIAAGDFSESQAPEFDQWVEINTSRSLRKGMFVAKVIGRSMEPLISNGAYCLFQYRAPNIRNGTVGLFQLHNEEDPEFGGRFTVKRLQLSTQPDSDGGFQRMSILAPENPEFKPISVESDDIRFIAEFLEVLKPLTDVSVKAGERYLFQ